MTGACYEVKLLSTTEPNIFVKIAQKDPETPTPTPTQTPTPQQVDCCEGLTESSPMVNGSLEDKNGISGNGGDATGGGVNTSCVGIQHTTSLPSEYLCPFEVSDFSKGGMSIVVGANLTDTLFRFEASDGSCYETNLINTSANGVNIFVKIN